MSKPLLWTSIAAVLVSTFSLAASGWVIANERGNRIVEAPSANAPSLSSASRNLDDSNASDAPMLPEAAPAAKDEPKAAPTTQPVVSAEPADLKVKRLVVTSAVKDREPVSSSDAFTAGDDRVYAFVELANRSSHEGGIVIVFEHGSTRTGNVELAIPAEVGRWRTWGYTRALREAGTWNVVVREQSSGKELARTAIEVKKVDVEPAKIVEQPVMAGTI